MCEDDEGRVKYIFQYSNGEEFAISFNTEEAAERYARMEGDHLIYYERVTYESSD